MAGKIAREFVACVGFVVAGVILGAGYVKVVTPICPPCGCQQEAPRA